MDAKELAIKLIVSNKRIINLTNLLFEAKKYYEKALNTELIFEGAYFHVDKNLL